MHGVVPAIVVAADRCFIVCNTATGASGTPVYVIAAGNSFGQIADVSGVGDISSVTDSPWTNFIH